MNIVVDTNVFIGACKGNGASAEVVAACLRGEYVALMGAALLAEYEDVLGREVLFAGSRLTSAERSELLDIFLASCRWTRIYYCWRPNLPDESDNHLIELAVAGGAGCIVTHNPRDLAHGELLFPNTPPLTPVQFYMPTGRYENERAYHPFTCRQASAAEGVVARPRNECESVDR